MSVWFITGASRGFGAEIVEKALEAGHEVVATARQPEVIDRRIRSGRLMTAAVDVTVEAEVAAAIDGAVARFGRLDVLVNNAGRGLLGAVEEASDVDVRAVYDTNVFGTLNVIRAALPTMRAQRSGHVINMSSVGGFVGSPGWGIYNSTKFAVEGFSEALAKELSVLGVTLTIVEPGYFRTDFLDDKSLHSTSAVLSDYATTAGVTRATAAQVNHLQPGDPVKAAAAIVALGSSANPPLRVQLGRDAFDAVAAKIAYVADEQYTWHDMSTSMGYDDVATC